MQWSFGDWLKLLIQLNVVGGTKQAAVCVMYVGIRGEDAGMFGCILQGDADVVNAAYINVHVRGRQRWGFLSTSVLGCFKIRWLHLKYDASACIEFATQLGWLASVATATALWPNSITSILLKTCIKPGFRPGFEQVCNKSATKKLWNLLDLSRLDEIHVDVAGLRPIFRLFGRKQGQIEAVKFVNVRRTDGFLSAIE